MDKRFTRSVLPVIFIFFTANCSSGTEENTADSPQSVTTPGKGFFTFNQHPSLAEKPLKVWFYNAAGSASETAELPVMILMHGNSRAAESYLDAMAEFAGKYNFLLIVPEFSKEQYPSSRDYHQGGVLTRDREPVNEQDWAFSVIEPLFDYVKASSGNIHETYTLYGFSAGSQFVHRFLMHKPDNRAEPVIAASAGTYSMPDFDIDYSYGLKNTVVTSENLVEFFNKDLTLMVGAADTVLSRSDLVKSEAANRQGRDRVKRGMEFFHQSRQMAEALGTSFNWEMVIVPDAGHSQRAMAEPVAKELFEN